MYINLIIKITFIFKTKHSVGQNLFKFTTYGNIYLCSCSFLFCSFSFSFSCSLICSCRRAFLLPPDTAGWLSCGVVRVTVVITTSLHQYLSQANLCKQPLYIKFGYFSYCKKISSQFKHHMKNICSLHSYLRPPRRLCNYWRLSVCQFVCEQRNSKA